ncbi:MAG: DUF551 domain-containing protein [Proteobacteria bacterium]|nr:DUF551 domain-containing protein [Pseudomonadota bacterium]
MADIVQKLAGALEGLTAMYAKTWDVVEGGLAMMSDSVEEFEKAHDAARAALSEAKAGGWVSPYDSVPQPDQTVLVWSRQTWETAPSLKIDTWAMQREAPLSFSTATIETGYGWDDHEDFESVIAWQPLPAPPAQKDPT